MVCLLVLIVCNLAATRSNKPPSGTPGFHPDETALDCECLPPCTETQYSVESNYIQTYFAIPSGCRNFLIALAFPFRSNLESKRGTGYVDVFFKQMGGVRYRNDVMFGWMDLLGKDKISLVNDISGTAD